MCERLFHGKRVDNGEWIKGSLIDSGNHMQVAIYPWISGANELGIRQLVPFRMAYVILETVGQYTGIKTYSKYDEELHKIFENDLCYVTEFDYEGKDKQHRYWR